jgi:hypothetical protein
MRIGVWMNQEIPNLGYHSWFESQNVGSNYILYSRSCET